MILTVVVMGRRTRIIARPDISTAIVGARKALALEQMQHSDGQQMQHSNHRRCVLILLY